ncbi:AAR2 protein-domain-containing protein, partial [Tribonema minus]
TVTPRNSLVHLFSPPQLSPLILNFALKVQELVTRRFHGSWHDLLGEVQLSFILFLYISSLAAYRQWQALTAALCRCETAVESNGPFFVAYIRVLHAQLKLVPEDFFATELSRENFLQSSLTAMFQVRPKRLVLLHLRMA